MSATPVEVVLDLTSLSDGPRGKEDFQELWGELAPVLVGRDLASGREEEVEVPQRGLITLRPIHVPAGAEIVSDETDFAVHAVLERPLLRHKCAVCGEYGPFRCSACPPGKEKRLCDDHVVILDGSMRAFCPEHAPPCAESGKPATFWCDGPRCRGRVAWSKAYRRSHPHDQDHWYCPTCYEEEFPQCPQRGCQDTGNVSCEFIDRDTGKGCGCRACNRHAWRWQIYGPHRLGLGLCPEHHEIRRLTNDEILFQIAAGTVQRNLQSKKRRRSGQREFFPLPTLQSIRHIFIHARNAVYDVRSINRALDGMVVGLGSNELNRAIAQLIQRSGERRERDIQRDDAEKNVGADHFRRLQQTLIAAGANDLAEALKFSDFRPRANVMFVHLDEQWRGLFIGKGGSRIKELERTLGFRIKFEKG